MAWVVSLGGRFVGHLLGLRCHDGLSAGEDVESEVASALRPTRREVVHRQFDAVHTLDLARRGKTASWSRALATSIGMPPSAPAMCAPPSGSS
jgi:hypothetical protein